MEPESTLLDTQGSTNCGWLKIIVMLIFYFQRTQILPKNPVASMQCE